jgi:hypothetical protein
MTYAADDPRLTAYALGELDEAEVAEWDAAVAADPALAAAVEEIRHAAGVVREALQLEATPELTDEQRAAVTSRRAPIPFRLRRRVQGWSTLQRFAAVVVVGVGLFGTYSVVYPYVAYSVLSVQLWRGMIRDSAAADSASRMSPESELQEFSDDLPHNRLLHALGFAQDVRSSYGYTPESRVMRDSARAGATPELAPDIALQATALWQSLKATQPPPPPRTGGADASSLPEPVPDSAAGTRMIIKNAEMSVEVESVPLALSRIDAIAAESGGYVTQTRTEIVPAEGEVRTDRVDSATIGFSVPVARFEGSLARVREVGRVLGESASGADVTQEYVDTQSQIANLEATQARVRSFLDRAGSVEEALNVNAQLTEIEGQISTLKGRLQYLAGRSAFSTITVDLHQALPAATHTPTPTVTPTPSPTPTATPSFRPGETAHAAFGMLKGVGEQAATLLIWLVVAVLPLVAVITLVGWVALRIYRRLQRRGE